MMIAFNVFCCFMVTLCFKNVITYQPSSSRIMTPTNQQSGNTVPGQGNMSNINAMFPPVNNMNTILANKAMSSGTATSGALTPPPVASQTSPTNPISNRNYITSTTPPTLTSTTSTAPTVTEVVINSPNNGAALNTVVTVEFPLKVNIIITSGNGDGLTTSRPRDLSTIGSTETVVTSDISISTASENSVTSSNSNTVSTVSENPATPPSATGSTVEMTTDNISSTSLDTVTAASESPNTTLSIVSENPMTSPTASESTVEVITENITSTSLDTVTAASGSPNTTLSTARENPMTPPTASEGTVEVITENITSTSLDTVTAASGSPNATLSTVSENPMTPPTASESTVEVITENITSTSLDTVTAASESPNATLSTVRENPMTPPTASESTIEVITENISSTSLDTVTTASESPNATLSTVSENPMTPPTASESTIEVITENISSTSLDTVTTASESPNATLSTVSENPMTPPTASESTIEVITENITSTSLDTVTAASESPNTTLSTVELVTSFGNETTISDNPTASTSATGSTVEMNTENITSTSLEAVTTASETPNTTLSTVGSTVELVTSLSNETTVSDNPVTSNSNGDSVDSSSNNPITPPRAVKFVTEKPVNIHLPGSAPNGIFFLFPTRSSTAVDLGYTTTNIDLSDPGQNGINFGFTTSSSNGNLGQLPTPVIQNNMIFETKCEEYHNTANRQVRTAKVQVFIIGGTNSLPHEFPHMAALGYTQEARREWLCGGSLISENYVITAAHCLSSGTLGEIQFVRLGTNTLQTETLESEDYNVIRRIPHPEYKIGEQYNDVALLQLDRPVTFSEYIQPICLSASKDIVQQKLIATGWGRTEPAGEVSPELQKVDLEYFPNSDCQQIYAVVSREELPRGIDDNTQICAGSRTEPKDTCQGDSGGPLQIEENGRMYLVGITSFGLNCGQPGSPGVYTRVSYYIPWIEQTVWPNGK